jgi:dihydrofolate reductase
MITHTPPTTHLKLIVACAQNRVIGLRGKMPWHIPSELKQFKRLTMGQPLIMGHTTWDSIIASLGHPLPGRHSIVLTRKLGWAAEGATTANSIDQAIAACADAPTAWVIGGAQVYAQFLSHSLLNECHVTEIKADFEGDAWFTQLNPLVWKIISRTPNAPEPSNCLSFDTVVYQRIKHQS